MDTTVIYAANTFTLLTRGFNAVYERLHLFVTFGLIGIEISTSTDDATTPVSKLTVGLIFLLTTDGIWSEKKILILAG